MKEEIAVKIEGISKTFKIPHEKHTSLKSAALNIMNKRGYTKLEALKDVNLEIKKGEFVGFIGRNGSGKSTLLKILAGIYVPDQGHIHINGKLSPFLELGVGFNPELSGRDNIFLGGAILGLSRKEIEKKYQDIVNFSELEEFIDMKYKNYSSGMQVRLAFSLAINVYADILLMDEVLAVGDSNFQLKCLNEFKRYKEEGKTVILVSHDINTIQKYCDKVMLLVNGKPVLVGDAKTVTGEYIRQNIDDMNKGERISDLPKGHKVAEVTSVVFKDKKGNVKDIFQSGEDITVRVKFKRDKNTKDLNFGVALMDQGNQYIYGVNTFFDKIDKEKTLKQSYFEVTYKEIPLREGIYFIKAGIWSNSGDDMIDFLDSSGYFTIQPNDNDQGLIHIKHDWK